MPAYGGFSTGSATADLGFGGAGLAEQVAGETEEERKRRLAQLQAQRLAGSAATPATMALFGTGLGPRLGGARMGIGQM